MPNKLDDIDIECEEIEEGGDRRTEEGSPSTSYSYSPQKQRTENTENNNNNNNNQNAFHLSNHQLPIVGGFFSALIFLIAIISKGGINKSSYKVYGIILSVMAMLLCLIAWGLSNSSNNNTSGNGNGNHQKLLQNLHQSLFVWNFIGACIMTFGGGPFVITSNGYFAVWGMTIFAVMALGISFSTIRNAGCMVGHLAASIIVIISLICQDKAFQYFKEESIFGIVLACISTLIMSYYVITSQRLGREAEQGNANTNNSNIIFFIMAALAVSWIVAASFMTFRGPFVLTGNGYFGAWGGAITAVFAAMEAKRESQ